MSFANPIKPQLPAIVPAVGWKADAAKERDRGRIRAADLQAPGKFPKPPRRPTS